MSSVRIVKIAEDKHGFYTVEYEGHKWYKCTEKTPLGDIWSAMVELDKYHQVIRK